MCVLLPATGGCAESEEMVLSTQQSTGPEQRHSLTAAPRSQCE